MTPRVLRPDSDNRVFVLFIGALTLFAGVISGLLALQPLAAMATAGLTVLAALLIRAQRLDTYFLAGLGVILIGYAIFGRGFAYIGAPPLFVGEIVLCLGVLALLVNVSRWRFGLIEALLLIFIVLGAVATVPHLAAYGVDALRDAVVWGYALIALGVAWLFRREHFEVVTRWYRRLIVPFVFLAPIILVSTAVLGIEIPLHPGSGVPIIDVKPGDTAVHLAGVAAFVLTGLWVKRSDLSTIAEILFWAAWFVGFLMAAAWNRGGLVAATLAITATLVLRPNRKVFVPIFLSGILLTAVVLIDPNVPVTGHRTLSIDQLAANFTSVVSDSDRVSLQGTREWRLQWWSDIVAYTVHGEYFWNGKGFGINLARDDGFAESGEGGLRSPHSSHMTVLARMGVPGIVFWIALQVAFAGMMIRAIYRSYHGSDPKLTSIMVVILAYWLAMIVNSSFDVYIEGPQGGIWFWAIFGLGLAAARIQRTQEKSNHVDTRSGQRPDAQPEYSPDANTAARRT